MLMRIPKYSRGTTSENSAYLMKESLLKGYQLIWKSIKIGWHEKLKAAR